MKTAKRTLSLLLSILMLMSVMTVGFTAFAADKTDAVTALEKKINAYSGNVGVAEPSEADLAGYNELTSAYKSLSVSEKESMDVLAFEKLYHYVIDRERQVSIKENTSIASYNKQHYINAAAALPVVLGTLPAYVEESIALAAILNKKSTSTEAKKEAFAAASENARMFAGVYNESYEIFYYALEKYPTKGFELVVTAIQAELLKANPSDPKPARLKKPNAKDYELGVDDPQYKADYEAYLEGEEAYYTWYAGDYTHKGDLYIQAMRETVAVAPEYKPMLDALIAARDAKMDFDEDVSGAADNAEKAVETYGKLSELDKLRFDTLTYYFYAVPVDKTTSWSYRTYRAKDLYSACVDIGNAKFVDDFITVINGIDEPYTRADIEAAKDAYNKVPSTLIGTIPEEVAEKYKAILASIGPDEATDERPNVESIPNITVKYPFLAGKKTVTRSIGDLEDVILSMMDLPEGGLPQLISEGVYTNGAVGILAQQLYPKLAQLTSLLSVTPDTLAAKLTEEKFAGAVETLNAAIAATDENGEPISGMAAWGYVSFRNGDWGFEDGDREGFLDAVTTLFRPLSLLTMAITFENKIDTANGTYTYGAYEDLVPIFEALDLRGIMSSHDYTLAVNSAATSELKMDARIRPILVPIFNLIDDIAADPMNGILNLLPKVGLMLKTDLLDTQIQKLVSKVKMVSIPEFSLKTDAIFDMIAPALQNIEFKAAEYDEQGNEISPAVTVSIELSRSKFISLITELAGCGTYAARDSIARGQNYYVGIDSDRTDAYVVLFGWLHSELTEEVNIKALKSVVDAAGMNKLIAVMVKGVVDVIGGSSRDGALRTVTYALPVVNVVVKIVKFVEGIFA